MGLSPFTNVTAVRMLWQDANLAIGETYYNTNPPSQSGTGLYVLAMNLFKARSLMMGAGVVPVGVRMSLIGVRRSYIKVSPADITGVPVGTISITVNPAPAFAGNNPNNNVDGSAAQGPDAILTDVYGSVATSHARKYLSGCPNVLVRTNPVGPWTAGDAQWGNYFTAYGNVLTTTTNGWVMKVIVPVLQSTPPQVLTYSLDPTSTFLQVTVPTLPGSPNIGSSITLHGARMVSRAYKAPNGTWAVRPPAPVTVGPNTTYTLNLPFAARFPYLESGYGYCGALQYMADTYSAVNLGREGEHKRGNSVLAPRGKRRVAQQISL